MSAVKWIANREPERDKAGIGKLIASLNKIQAKTFVHISTIDVYGDRTKCDEYELPCKRGLEPYGLHRLELEEYIRQRFENSLILRLPALFGIGLKKNPLFDLMNKNILHRLNPASSMQWYPLDRLATDIELGLNNRLHTLNVATPPITLSEINDAFFNSLPIGAEAAAAAHYDMHTRYAPIFNTSGPYLMSRAEVMSAMCSFVTGA